MSILDSYDTKNENIIKDVFFEVTNNSKTYSQTPHLTEKQRQWAKKLKVNPAKAWSTYATRDTESSRDEQSTQALKELGNLAADRMSTMRAKLNGLDPSPSDEAIEQIKQERQELELEKGQRRMAEMFGLDADEALKNKNKLVADAPKAELEAQEFRHGKKGFRWSNVRAQWEKISES